MEAKVKDFLSKLHIIVPNEWLRECIQFVIEDAGQRAKQPNWAQANLAKLVYEQWLEANLKELQSCCLPPNLASAKKTVINGHFALQVNSLLDISQPAYQQCMKLEGVDRSNAEVTAEPISQKKENSNRMLKMEMTDGVQTIHGMEYEAIPSLNVNLPPGTKVLVFGTVDCRRGILHLTKEKLKVLGGQVEDFGTTNNQRQLLRRILKFPQTQQAVNHNAEASPKLPVVPPALGDGQELASRGPQNSNDEDDSIWQEDIGDFDMDDFEPQNVAPTPKRNIPKPPLTAINAAIGSEVDFDDFDDDDDAFQ